MTAAAVLGVFALVPEDLPHSHRSPWCSLWSVAYRTPGAWRIGGRRAAELAGVTHHYARILWPRIRQAMFAMDRWQQGSHSQAVPRTPYSRGLAVVEDEGRESRSHSGEPSRAEEVIHTHEQIQPKARARAKDASRSFGGFWWRWVRELSRAAGVDEVERLRHEDGGRAGDAARAFHRVGGFDELDRMRVGKVPGVAGVGAHFWRFKAELGLVRASPVAAPSRASPEACGGFGRAPNASPVAAPSRSWLSEPTPEAVAYLLQFLPLWGVDSENGRGVLACAPWAASHPDLSALVGMVRQDSCVSSSAW